MQKGVARGPPRHRTPRPARRRRRPGRRGIPGVRRSSRRPAIRAASARRRRAACAARRRRRRAHRSARAKTSRHSRRVRVAPRLGGALRGGVLEGEAVRRGTVLARPARATDRLGRRDRRDRSMGRRLARSPGDRVRPALAVITRNFGWLYLWVVLGLVRDGRCPGLQPLRQSEAGRGGRRAGVLASAPGSPCCSPPAWASAWCSGAWPNRSRTTARRRPASPPARPRRPMRPCATLLPLGHAPLGRLQRGGAGDRLLPVPARRPAAGQHRHRRPALDAGAPRCRRLFNVLAVVATAFGVAASLGMGALQINSGLHAVVRRCRSAPTSQVVIIVVTTALFIASAVSGVEHGIKWLSSFNLVLAGAAGAGRVPARARRWPSSTPSPPRWAAT